MGEMRLSRVALYALLALVLWVPACAEEREPINRVQAGALEKSFFVGSLADPGDNPEFYSHVNVVDVAMGAGADGLFTNSDAQPMTRVRWEITEELLIARLSYELIDDTDYRGARRTADGQIVAAYAIRKHFDVKRAYNESTGEDYNIVEENEGDRPWYQREYFRVDWSRNLITTAYDLDTLSQLGIYYGVEYEPVAYYVEDPSDPDVPVFDLARGYFDVTNKVYAKPLVIEDPEWGDFPACWLIGAWPATSCNPSELTLRQAFLKVTDTDYEPMVWDGTRMEMFGYFSVDRFGYDRSYGIVDDKWRRLASRWNLFEKSHASPEVLCATTDTTPTGADPHRDDDQNGTEDECESVGRGSRCDAIVGKCTIPYRDRKVKPVVWHVNREFPAELFQDTELVLKDWSAAMRTALLAGRLAECRRTKQSDCEREMGWPSRWSDDFVPPLGAGSPAEVPEVFVLCHNPVDPEQGDDVALCGAAGTSPRVGDLRFNLVNMVQDPELMSPWGIMMDAEDPLTGEKISGSVSQWGAVLDRAAATLVDLLGLLNGEIDPESYIAGQNVSDWVKANQPGGLAERATGMSKSELAERQRAFDPSVLAPYLSGLGGGKPGAPPALRKKLRAKALSDAGRLGPGNSVLSARLAALRDTPFEAKLVSPELVQAAGFDPTGPVTSEAVKRGSPFRRLNPTQRRAQERALLNGRAERHSCKLKAPEPDNLLGLAKRAQQLFPSPDPNDKAALAAHRAELLLWARQEFSRGVFAHELGHSMGLRHNFAASFDSLNYEAGYWQLRTNNGAATNACPDGTTDGSSCVGPRYKDPETPAEIDGSISYYATTSVMDYPGDQSQDTIRPRKYDRAALRLGYGNVVDVWQGASVTASGASQNEAYKLTAFTTPPGLFGINYFPPVDPFDPYEFIHYSQYNNEFSLISNCAADSSPDAVLGQRCEERALDVVDYRDMRDFYSDPDYADFVWAKNSKAIDATGRVRRGYMFSSDEYADSGNVPSFTSDAGADAYEQIRFLEGQYENRYILDAFRRNRTEFNSWDVSGRIQYRYLDKIQLIAKAFAFGALLEGDPSQPAASLLQDGYYGPLAIGSTVALDLFARILTRPEPGYYCAAADCGYVQPLGVVSDVFVADPVPLPALYDYDFRVSLGEGRYLHNDYDYSQGYWWGDYQTQVGTYYEKIWATYYLAEAFDSFISNSKEDFTDSRYKNVSFATVFPEQVRRLYTNLLTGDIESFAPWTVPTGAAGSPLANLTYPKWYDANSVGTRPNNAAIVDPNYAFNEQIYAMVWGSMFFPTNWSNRWVHDATIAIDPFETPGWPAAETVAFFYPPTGLTYKAHSTGTEDMLGYPVQKSAGARMLEWANWLTTYAYLVETDAQGYVVYNADGTPTILVDGQGRPRKNPAYPEAEGVLSRYVDQIDTMRQLTKMFERPLGDWDLPQP